MIPSPMETEAIVGVELFNPYVVFIDFKNKVITIEKEEDLRRSLERKESQ